MSLLRYKCESEISVKIENVKPYGQRFLQEEIVSLMTIYGTLKAYFVSALLFVVHIPRKTMRVQLSWSKFMIDSYSLAFLNVCECLRASIYAYIFVECTNTLAY